MSHVLTREYLGATTVTCTEPETAPCRYQCPDGCEEWEAVGHEHGYEIVTCLAIMWWDAAGDFLEAFIVRDDPIAETYEGPITVSWEGHYWGWDLAEEAGRG